MSAATEITTVRDERSSIELDRDAKGRFLPGEQHPNWKGDAVSPTAARYRAHAVIPELGVCEKCGLKPARHRHHINENTKDNEPSNLARLCVSCHARAHGRIPPRPDPEVVSRRFKGATPWNKGLTKADAPSLARPGRGKRKTS